MGEAGFPTSPFILTANGRNWLMALRKKHAVQGGDADRYVKVEKKKVEDDGCICYRCVDFREIPVLIIYDKTNSRLSMKTLSGTTYRYFDV